MILCFVYAKLLDWDALANGVRAGLDQKDTA